jgi:hypothetical protein
MFGLHCFRFEQIVPGADCGFLQEAAYISKDQVRAPAWHTTGARSGELQSCMWRLTLQCLAAQSGVVLRAGRTGGSPFLRA